MSSPPPPPPPETGTDGPPSGDRQISGDGPGPTPGAPGAPGHQGDGVLVPPPPAGTALRGAGSSLSWAVVIVGASAVVGVVVWYRRRGASGGPTYARAFSGMVDEDIEMVGHGVSKRARGSGSDDGDFDDTWDDDW